MLEVSVTVIGVYVIKSRLIIFFSHVLTTYLVYQLQAIMRSFDRDDS